MVKDLTVGREVVAIAKPQPLDKTVDTPELNIKLLASFLVEDLYLRDHFPDDMRELAEQIIPLAEQLEDLANDLTHRELLGLSRRLYLLSTEISMPSFKLPDAKKATIVDFLSAIRQVERVASDVLQCELGQAQHETINGKPNPFFGILNTIEIYLVGIKPATREHAIAIKPLPSPSISKGAIIAFAGVGVAIATVAAVVVAHMPGKEHIHMIKRNPVTQIEPLPDSKVAAEEKKLEEQKNSTEGRGK